VIFFMRHLQNALSMAKIILRSKSREPLEFLWNLVLPIIAFSFVFHEDIGKSYTHKEYFLRISSFLSWIIFQSSFYGVGMAILSWRESGFLKSLIFGHAHKKNLVLSLLMVQFFYTLLFGFSILVFSSLFFQTPFSMDYFIFFPFMIVFTICFSLLSLCVNILPYSHENISTIISILIFPLAWSSSQHNTSTLISTINLINPMAYFNQSIYLYFNGYDPVILTQTLLFILITCILGAFGLRKFKIISVVKR
jgi:hypothetical protein